ncbi:uncharacterized protein PV06_07972 [Exophiala oligosperma]|uniref:Uncharacterized protein n=1 Tax=Exophiala oligosperma TaxID=215243 RepID=A0A0D2DYZ6_9EURO|nr:uncharacterized protein PV06_07972 [Exophiala oligosperma]KIW40799.1 hypothetical protein PV06_07972 [Exophiala oligosperma]
MQGLSDSPLSRMEEYSEAEFGRIIPLELGEDQDMQDVLGAEPCVARSRRASQPSAMRHCAGRQPEPGIESQHHDIAYPRYIIAVDFGTTYSSVAFVRIDHDTQPQHIRAEFVECIDKYPNMPPITDANILAKSTTVPTELLYDILENRTNHTSQPSTDSWDLETSSTVSLDELWEESSTTSLEQEVDQISPVANNDGRPPRRKPATWGWGVYSRLLKPDSTSDWYHLTNFKLHLDPDRERSAALLRESVAVMKALKGLNTEDIIATYLENLLRHAKSKLSNAYGFHENSTVEFVLSVPAAWDGRAGETMQKALDRAVRSSGIIKLKKNETPDLFMVAEPEAALAYVLDNDKRLSDVVRDESLMIIDAGGGTVDFTVCTLTRTNPPRYKEAVRPDGVSCGSCFLNRRFRALLKDRLADAIIIDNGVPLESIIDAKVIDFETLKRSIDVLDKNFRFEVYIPGLQEDGAKGFGQNKMDITRTEMYRVFSDSLHDVAGMMSDQLNAAREKGVNVQKVVLIGGFGQSPSLYKHLKKALRRERNFLGLGIELLRPELVESAVARGAVLRALRKEDGPERISRWSYGLLWTVVYDPKNDYHRRSATWRDPSDGQICIKDTIQWFVDKDTRLNARHEFPIDAAVHIFKADAPKLLCEERLYVSGQKHPSGYKVTHQRNRGSKIAGTIMADMTRLRDENRIQPITVINDQGKEFTYYEIIFDLYIIIEGRTLRFEARSKQGQNELVGSGAFCIAAGFKPGTA